MNSQVDAEVLPKAGPDQIHPMEPADLGRRG